MDLENIDEKIQTLHDEIFRQERTEKRLALIKIHLGLLYGDLSFHQSKMDAEHQDVQKLEKKSTLSLFSEILGNQNEQLERERQEYLQAVLEYNAIANEIDLLQYEQEVLLQIFQHTKDLKHQLDYYLKVKEQKLLFHNVEQATQIKAINKEIDRLKTFKRELQEAKSVAQVVEKVILKTFTKLKKVKAFQYSKMRGSGKNSSVKRSYIDEALKDASEINFYLGKLDKELSDVYSQYTFFSIYKYQNFVESFCDQLITDWVLQNKLKNAINCLQSAEDQIKRILATLNNDLSKTEDLIKAKIAKKRELVRIS
jgi:hypothetical protein